MGEWLDKNESEGEVERSRVGPAHTVKGEGRGDRSRAWSWRGLLVTLLAHFLVPSRRNYSICYGYLLLLLYQATNLHPDSSRRVGQRR
jgi:hypothetical protein